MRRGVMCCIFLAGLFGCVGPKGDLHVTSFAPPPEASEDPMEAIRITFDKPVAPENQVGEALDRLPYAITPALKTAAHFLDRQTLVIKPQEPMAPATRYSVVFAAPLEERLAKSETFSFVHLPLEVRELQGAEDDFTSTRPELSLRFNQPMTAKQVEKGCAVASEDGKHRVPVRVENGALHQTAIPFTVQEPLKKGTAYTLTCEKLLPEGGNEPLARPFTAAFGVHPALSILSFTPSGHGVTPDELEMVLTFSTPVPPEELASHIRIAPREGHFARGWTRRDATAYEQTLTLEASTDYVVTVQQGLKDRFGQTLDQKAEFRFTTTDATPSLRLETGIYAVEAEGEGYPVWSRNVPRVDLECASVPKRKVVELLTSDMNYDPWYSAGTSYLDWDRLGLRARKSRHPIPRAKNKWQLERLDLGELCSPKGGGKGLYLAEIRSDEVEAARSEHRGIYPYRLLGNVTDLGVLVKVGPASGLIWVSRISTGDVQAGAKVSLFNLQGKKVFGGVTDSRGVLLTPGSTTLLRQPGAGDKDPFEEEDYYEYDYYRSQRLIAMVEHGDDLAVVDGNWANGIQLWNFGVRSDRQSGDTRIRGFIQSDRGVYRPGETVHFKGLVRELSVGQPPRVPAGEKVKIHVEDDSGAALLDKRLPVSEFGGFHFSLPLDEGASLGDYHVSATLKKQTFRERFQVEEFRPVAFEITGKNPKDLRAGDPIALSFSADYLFGEPVKGADVSWNVTKQRHCVWFEKYSSYSFSDNSEDQFWYPWYEDRDYYDHEHVADGQGKTDAKGRFRFSVKEKTKMREYPERYFVTATVTDRTDQTVSKRLSITAHPVDFYLGLHAQEWVQAVDMPFAVNALAVTPEGKTVAADATLSFTRYRWQCDTKGTYRTYSDCKRNEEKVWSRPVRIPSNTHATERITPKAPGEYTIRLEGKDSRGQQVSASTSVWVIGRGEAFWSGDESARMSIIPSKDEYKPGETATLVPRADTGGATLLVTLERNGILDAFVTKPDGPGQGIRIPVDDDHAPNVYASVAMIKGRRGEGDRNRPVFKLGIADLKVSAAKHRLKVKIETERQDYEPGELVKGTVRVHSAEGAPVKAEVSLSAADEGILQLIAFVTPDPMKAFYAPWGLGVDNSTNWNRIARLNDPTGGDGEDGADGDDGSGDQFRSRFVSSAYWEPALVTDDNGEIAFRFAAPDNLTAFRLMAAAADRGRQFGAGESRVRINKKLLAKPVLPRFFGEGDRTRIGMVVHNYTGEDGEATVTAELQGLWTKEKVKRVQVKAGESARVDFLTKAGARKEAVVRMKVAMGAFSDGFEKRLPVRRPLAREAVVLGEESAEDVSFALTFPDEVLERESEVEVVVDRTGLSGLSGSLKYLVRYPYGCLEQTLSGLIPLFKVKDLAKSLRLDELKGPKLDTYIRLGVAKVLRHQHHDGHFSLWPGASTQPHLTAYALWGLGEARRAGVAVNEKAVAKGIDALTAWVNDRSRAMGPGGESATMAMAAFVLADNGRPSPALSTRLFEARASLPVYGAAFLLMALTQAKGPADQIATLRTELAGRVTHEKGSALVRESQGSLSGYMSSDTRTTAIVLMALVASDPSLPVIQPLVAGLKGRRLAGGRWGNTQENLYALVALAAYAREQTQGSARVTLTLDGKKAVSKTVRGGDALRWRRPLAKLRGSDLRIESDQPVFHRAVLTLVQPANQAVAVDQGIQVTREYLDAEKETPVEKVEVGQLVKVRLKVTASRSLSYIALVDPLPAGCEAVNSRFATEIGEGGVTASYSWDHRELRDDEVRVFADSLRSGEHILTYLMRPAIKGVFEAAPTHVEEMYTPAVFGRSPSRKLEVR